MRPHNSYLCFNHFTRIGYLGPLWPLAIHWPVPVTLHALIQKGFRGLRHSVISYVCQSKFQSCTPWRAEKDQTPQFIFTWHFLQLSPWVRSIVIVAVTFPDQICLYSAEKEGTLAAQF